MRCQFVFEFERASVLQSAHFRQEVKQAAANAAVQAAANAASMVQRSSNVIELSSDSEDDQPGSPPPKMAPYSAKEEPRSSALAFVS